MMQTVFKNQSNCRRRARLRFLKTVLLLLFTLGAAATADADPITLTPPKLQFGPLLPIPPAVTIANTSAFAVTIQNVILSGRDANQFTFDDPMAPLVVDPGRTRLIQVVCRPVRSGRFTAQLVVVPQGFAPQSVDLECEEPPPMDMAAPRDMAHASADLSAGAMMGGGCRVGRRGPGCAFLSPCLMLLALALRRLSGRAVITMVPRPIPMLPV